MASLSHAWSGAAKLGGKLFSGLKSGEQGIGQAMGTIGSAYGGARQSLQPWQDYGTQTLADLRQFTTGDPTQAVLGDPTYKFGYEQGMTALENSAAARNRALSGRALKESMQYGQDYGTSKYGDILNRKLELAKFGYQPTLTAADLAIGEGGALAGLEAEKGKARQSRYQGYLDLAANLGGKAMGMYKPRAG